MLPTFRTCVAAARHLPARQQSRSEPETNKPRIDLRYSAVVHHHAGPGQRDKQQSGIHRARALRTPIAPGVLLRSYVLSEASNFPVHQAISESSGYPPPKLREQANDDMLLSREQPQQRQQSVDREDCRRRVARPTLESRSLRERGGRIRREIRWLSQADKEQWSYVVCLC